MSAASSLPTPPSSDAGAATAAAGKKGAAAKKGGNSRGVDVSGDMREVTTLCKEPMPDHSLARSDAQKGQHTENAKAHVVLQKEIRQDQMIIYSALWMPT